MALGPVLIFSLNILSAVVAFLTSYNAYRFNKLATNPLLKSIAFGFGLLGVGLLAEASVSVVFGKTLVEQLLTRAFGLIETFTYLSVQMVAYLAFAAGYAFLAFGRSTKVAAGLGVALAVGPGALDFVGLYRYAILSYLVVLLLLGFVVFEGTLIHFRSKSRFSLLVLLAFVLILAAHAVLLVSVLEFSGILFLLGDTVQFLGFVSLLIFLLRSGSVGTG